MFKLDLEKAEEPEIKFPTSIRSLKKQENSRKTFISTLLNMPKPLTVDIAELSIFAGILNEALSQHHLLGFEIAQMEFHHLH